MWSLMRRAMVNFVAPDLAGLLRIVKRKLKQIQYRPELIEGCLAENGLAITNPLIATPGPTSST
ncbi:hypothetical protein ACWC9T_39940 [Kitasatospora sp. NPDC001159]